MCFNKSKLSKHKKVKIAGRNITYYKSLLTDHYKECIVSPWRGMIYFHAADNVGSVSIKRATFDEYHELQSYIDKGLHSFSTLDVAQYEFGNTIYKAYIPKGAKYYYNECNHEYVSEVLAVIKIKAT